MISNVLELKEFGSANAVLERSKELVRIFGFLLKPLIDHKTNWKPKLLTDSGRGGSKPPIRNLIGEVVQDQEVIQAETSATVTRNTTVQFADAVARLSKMAHNAGFAIEL